jgi:hypothetical protein
MFNGKHVSHKAKTATVLTVSAKHASTTSGTGTSDTPLIETKSAIKTDRNWDWLPLQPQYQAARKTIVLCHGDLLGSTILITGLFGFDKLGFDSLPKLQFYYWGAIPEALRQLGCRVLITKVPRFEN